VQYHNPAARRMRLKENHAGQSGLDLTDEERLTFFVFCFDSVAYSTYYFLFSFFSGWMLPVAVS
jgi:hypothetical protein